MSIVNIRCCKTLATPRSNWVPFPRPSLTGNMVSAVPTLPSSHSSAGREEGNYTRTQIDFYSKDSDNHEAFSSLEDLQKAPLLHSSESETFTSFRRTNFSGDSGRNLDKEGKVKPGLVFVILQHFPLIFGSILAVFLLFLAFCSYERPGELDAYFGIIRPIKNTNPASTSSATTSQHTRPHRPAPSHVISYENYTRFPLLSSEYWKECSILMGGFMSHGKFWGSGAMGAMDVVHFDDQDDYLLREGDTPVCTSTITYMLDGKVGLFADLALLAQAAAMAHERNRTLLIDDSYWNRGKWTDYFRDIRVTQPGPEPGCKAPPPEELVACPRTARHWVISSRTAMFHFGHEFNNNYEDPYSHNLNRLKPMYESTQESFRRTILPNAETAVLIQKARTGLLGSASVKGGDAAYVAVHIRRGDHQFSRHEGRINTEDFVKAAIHSWERLNPDKSIADMTLYIASDSPSASEEVLNIKRSQYSVFSLVQSEGSELRSLASPREYVQSEFDDLDQNTKIKATLGVIVDFALASGFWTTQEAFVPDAVVCTIRSNICKLAAVGLGWDKAFGEVGESGDIDNEGKGWVEIDEDGHVWPIWMPFQLF